MYYIKIFLKLHSINWSNFIVYLPLLLAVMGYMCIAIVCFPSCDVINVEINLIFLIKPFFYMTEKSRQKFKYFVKTKRAFKMKLCFWLYFGFLYNHFVHFEKRYQQFLLYDFLQGHSQVVNYMGSLLTYTHMSNKYWLIVDSYHHRRTFPISRIIFLIIDQQIALSKSQYIPVYLPV